jgi:predicted ABC-type ATPase
VDRYYRSLDLLLDAVRLTDRAYLFDNSGREPVLIAEVTDGRHVQFIVDPISEWLDIYLRQKVLRS